MTARKAISKRLRFAIFARDKFTCRYCGKQPPEVVLVIDHMIPVAEGGTNEETNLITSCPCNAGKGKTVPITEGVNDQDTMRMAQEYAEQKRVAELAAQAAEARESFRQTLCNYWCRAFKVKTMPIRFLTIIAQLSQEFGAGRVMEWIDLTAAKGIHPDSNRAIMYIRGIARTIRERDEIA